MFIKNPDITVQCWVYKIHDIGTNPKFQPSNKDLLLYKRQLPRAQILNTNLIDFNEKIETDPLML